MTDVLHPPKDWLLHIYLASRTSPCKQKLLISLSYLKYLHVNKKERKVAFILHLYRDNESGVELEAWIVAHLRSAVCDVNVCHVFTHTLWRWTITHARCKRRSCCRQARCWGMQQGWRRGGGRAEVLSRERHFNVSVTHSLQCCSLWRPPLEWHSGAVMFQAWSS